MRAAPLLLVLACGSSPPATHPRFDLVAALQQDDFFALPYPNDARRTAQGIDLSGFPNPRNSSLLVDYVMAMREQPGFGQASALYTSFDGPIDPSTITADSVQLVDLQTGERIPLQKKWFAQASLFVPANTLALLPLFGIPLRKGHAHALVVTEALRDASGNAVKAAPGMTQVDSFRAFAAAHPGYEHVALASVFTVQDPSQLLVAMRAAVRATPEPAATGLSCTAGASFHTCTGEFPVPNFQSGTPPYFSSGGRILTDAAGAPIVQRTESVRFALTLPKGAGPFPAVLYQHGTGGDYQSFIREGLAADMASRGAAMISMDQVLHGPRNPGCWPPTASYDQCVGTAYFNFINPWAGRDNTRQGAADGFQLLRFAKALRVPASVHPQGLAVQLDGARIAFLGHSQGGITGAPFVAAEPELKGAALSGTGGTLAITVLLRKDPVDFKSLAELLLGIQGKEELDAFNPVLMVLQTFGEPADPISYGRHLAKEPLGGGARSVLLTEGLLDPYTSAQASEALGVAALFDIGGTAAHQSEAFLARGLNVDALPRDVPAGSGLLLQFPNDGHFAIFDNAVARCRVMGFLTTALQGAARVEGCGG